MKVRTEQFVEIAREEMKNTRSKAFLGLLPPVINAMRQISLATFPDPDAAQAYGAAIRGEVVTRLPELLEEFERNATARGTRVVWARSAGRPTPSSSIWRKGRASPTSPRGSPC